MKYCADAVSAVTVSNGRQVIQGGRDNVKAYGDTMEGTRNDDSSEGEETPRHGEHDASDHTDEAGSDHQAARALVEKQGRRHRRERPTE